MSNPKVSIIMATYNRAHTLPRAIDSVLAQDFSNWELIVVDGCSTDNTAEVMAQYSDSRIHFIRQPYNMGVCAAKNAGFDRMAGEWFTTLDSDDELTPDALSTMLAVPEQIDRSIDAVTCNCLDTTTGKFSGEGPDHDRWLDFETVVTQCSGEHFGLTKSSLLGNLRFNERLLGLEGTLWQKIDRRARRYYIHKALRIYHTEGSDRISNSVAPVKGGRSASPAMNEATDGSARLVIPRVGIEKFFFKYRELANETEYLETLEHYRPDLFLGFMYRIMLVRIIDGNKNWVRCEMSRISDLMPLKKKIPLFIALLLPPAFLRFSLIMCAKLRSKNPFGKS